MARSDPPFKRLLVGYSEDSETGCWMWRGQTHRNGYGWLSVFGKITLAHRFSHELHNGPIPAGMEILHSCDTKACINPAHLRAGTRSENMTEAAERGLLPSGSKHSQSIQVVVLGKPFGSINQAEKHLGLGSGTVGFWLKKKPHKARIISKTEYENRVGIS